MWFTSIQAGNTAYNYRTHYHLVLSHETYQNRGICYVTIAYCYVTKMFVARNKFPHVKVARNTKKVGQAWHRQSTCLRSSTTITVYWCTFIDRFSTRNKPSRSQKLFFPWSYYITAQNRRQEVFTRGALRSCGGLNVCAPGAWYWKFDKISNYL